MTTLTLIPSAKVPFTETDSGLITIQWYRYLYNLYNITSSGGLVTDVTATSPVVSSGGITPNISIPPATTSNGGYLTATDWNFFYNKQATLVSGTNIKTVGGVSLLGSGDVGTIGIAYGGTGQTTANAAFNALIPSQTTNAGKYLTTDGTNTSWAVVTGGDVVGPSSATDNAIARFDTTTGKLIQNSVVTISDTGAATGFTTLSASTSVTTPIVQATNSAGLALKNASGTTQMSMGAGGGDNLTINVSSNLNGTNAQIDISPTGTGHVHINPTGSGSVQVNPTSVGTIDNMTIGATTPKNGSFVDLSVTGITSFDGSQGTAGQVLTSAGTGNTPTWSTPTTGTVTSVTGTAPVVSSGGATPAISMAAATTSVNGYLTSTDWNTFNNKQATLVSGTNIKTVGGVSLLGSGDVGTIGATYGGTGLSTYATGDLIYASATNTLSKLAAGTNGYVLTLAAGVPTWAAASGGGATITNDTTTATNIYPVSASAVSGTFSTAYTSNAKYLYKPSTGELQASEMVATNGLFVNNQQVTADYTISTGYNAMAVDLTVASGVTLTVSSGSTLVIL